jgi:hypothetical protein
MFATGAEDGEDHQVRVRKEPLFSFCASSFGDASECSQVTIPGEATQMFQTDASQIGNFIFGEELLARLNSDHPCSSKHHARLAAI